MRDLLNQISKIQIDVDGIPVAGFTFSYVSDEDLARYTEIVIRECIALIKDDLGLDTVQAFYSNLMADYIKHRFGLK